MNGLGCCYLGTTTYNAPDIARLLELPQLVVPVVTLAVGYPAGEVEDCGRLPVKCLIHRERYHEAPPEEIVVIYAEKRRVMIRGGLWRRTARKTSRRCLPMSAIHVR